MIFHIRQVRFFNWIAGLPEILKFYQGCVTGKDRFNSVSLLNTLRHSRQNHKPVTTDEDLKK